jgi:hypothetical protein
MIVVPAQHSEFTPDKEVKWPPGKMVFTGQGSTYMAGEQEQEVQNECSA